MAQAAVLSRAASQKNKEARALNSSQDRVVTYENDQVKIKFKTKRDGSRNWHAESHTNTEYELHVMLSGTVAFSAENEARVLGPLDAVLIAPGVYHLAGKEEGEILHFTFLFSVSSPKLADELACLGPCTFFRISSRIQHLCSMTLQEADANLPYKEQMIEAMMSQLFVEICRQLKVSDEARKPGKTENESLTRAEIIDSFFEKNHTGNSSGETALAEKLHISRRQLARVLQKTYGMDFRSKMVDVRLKHAAMLLRSTDMKVGEISFAVGFSSEGSLYKHFQQHYGMTPLKYRKQAANK